MFSRVSAGVHATMKQQWTNNGKRKGPMRHPMMMCGEQFIIFSNYYLFFVLIYCPNFNKSEANNYK